MLPKLPFLFLLCFLSPLLALSQNGENCAQAIDINNLPFTETNASSCSFASAGADSYCGSFVADTEGREIYYKFTPSESTCYNLVVQDWQVDPDDNDFSSDLHVTISEGCPTAGGSTCMMAETINFATLTNLYFEAGKTYYIVFDHDDFNNDCIIDLDFTFSRCNIPTCADNPEAADDCVNATPICDLNGYCGSTETYHNDDENGINHCGSVENNTWLKFTANATQVELRAYAFDCSNGDGIQMWVGSSAQACNWSGASANGVACEGGSGFGVSYNDFTINGLTPGQTYYLMIDGFAGDVCKYVIEVVSGVLPLIDAGADFTVCTSGGAFQLDGSSSAANGWSWTTAGSGTFDNANTLDPNYTPSAADLAAGYVDLVLQHPGDGICNEADDDTVRVSFIDNQASIAPDNPMICLGQSTNLSVSFSNNDVPETGTQTFQNNTSVSIPDDGVSATWNGSTGNYAASKIDVSCLNPNSWTLTQYCLNISHTWPSDIAGVYLVNSCGYSIRLSSNGYTNGCFTPGTTAAWNTFLNCADPNGNWELRVGDDFNGDQGTINSFSLSFNSRNYFWSPATGLSATNVRNPVATPTSTTTYTLQVYDCASGCVLQDQVTVQVSDIKLTADVSNVTCNGANDGTVALIPSDFVGALSYKMGSGGYQSDSIFSGLAPGAYTFYARDEAGCETQIAVNITEPAILDLSTTVAPSDSCVIGATGSIAASSTGGTAPYTYFLNGAAQGAVNNYTGLSAGTYEVKVVDANGCEDIESISFQEKPSPSMTIANPGCSDLETLISAQNNVGSYSFSVTGDAGTNPSVGNTGNPDEFTLSVSGYGNVQVTMTATNGNCDSTIIQNVLFREVPDIDITVDKPLCDSLSTTVYIDVDPGTFTVDVSPSGSSQHLGGNAYRITVPSFSTYLLTVTADNLGCAKELKRTISFVAPANPSIAGPFEVCDTQANISVSPAGGVWSTDAPEIAIADVNSASTTVTLSGGYGQYPIYYETPAKGDCPAERDTSYVHFYENPQGSAGTDIQICEGEAVNLNGSTIVGQGQWTAGTGIQDVNDLSTALNLTSAGSYNYELTISNGVCPSITDEVTVLVDQRPVINLPDTLRFCELSGSMSGHTPVGNILWSSPDSEITFADPSNINSAVSATVDGFYKALLSDQNASCPEVKDSLVLHFVAPPVAQASVADSVCSKTFDLSATLSNPSHSGFWTGPGVFSPNKSSLNPQVTVPNYGTYNYSWTEKGHASCPGDVVNLSVVILEAPVADAGNDIAVCGIDAALAASASAGEGTWTWSAVDTAIGTLIFGDIHAANSSLQVDTNGVGYSGFGSYYLVWTEENGSVCPSSTDTVIVHFVPSSFPQAGPDQEVCGDTTLLNAIPSYGIGQWSYTGPGELDFTDIFDFQTGVWLRASNPVYGDYQLVWTEANSPCTANRDTLEITFYEPPTFDAGTSPDNVCGLSYTMAAQLSHGKSKWSWVANDPVDGTLSFVNGNDSTIDASVVASKYGSYTLYWTASYGVCTPAPDSLKLSFWERPTPDANAPSDVCATTPNQSIFLNGIASSGTKWTWSGPAGVTFVPDPFQTDVEAQVSAYGIYKFFFAEENHPVCGVVADSVIVEVLEKPEISAGVDDVTCGANYQLSGSIIKGKGDGSWSVESIIPAGKNITFSNPSDSTALITINPAPTVDPDTAYLVWTVQNGVSCPTVHDTVQIVFEPEPQQFFAGDDSTFCDTLSAHLYADALPSASFQGAWELISGPGNIVFEGGDNTREDVKITVSEFGVYKLIWRVNTASCPNGVVDELILDFREKPVANAGLDSLVCGLDILLNAGSIPTRASALWYHIGATANIVDPTSISTTASLPNGAFGDHFFVFETANGSIGACAEPVRDTVIMSLFEAPIADAGPDQVLCGDSTQLAALLSIDSTKTDQYLSNWSLVSGPGNVLFSPNSVLSSPDVKVDAFGDYLFKWKEENGVCPADSDLVSVKFVTSAQPQTGPDVDTCGLRITVTALPSFNSGRWIFPTGGVQAIFTNPNAFTTQLTVDEFGSYPVIWEETNSPCPSNRDTLIVSFNEAPKALAIPPMDFCGTEGTAQTLASVSEAQYVGYWNSSDANLNIQDSDSLVTALELLNEDYGQKELWWVEDNGSCPSDSAKAIVNFIAIPQPSAGPDDSICGLIYDLQALSSGAQSGVWSAIGANAANAAFDNPNEAQTTLRVSALGSYRLVYTEENYGQYAATCVNSDTVEISFFESLQSDLGPNLSHCGFELTLELQDTTAGSTITWSSSDLSISNLSKNQISVARTDSVEGSYWVYVNEDNRGVCQLTDSIRIDFSKDAKADIGLPFDTCGLFGHVAAKPSQGTGKWSYQGPGVLTFTQGQINQPAQSIRASAFGEYKLFWTEQPTAPCKASVDSMVVNFIEVPNADAGSDLQVCGNQAQINAIASVGAGKWSYNGALPISIVDDASAVTISILNSVDPADYQSIVLDWKEVNQGRCADSSSVNVEFVLPPSANAGSDQWVCGLSTQLNGIKNIGQSFWIQESGPAQASITSPGMDNSNLSVPMFGTYEFAFVVSNGPTCDNDTDRVSIHFIEKAEADAGEDIALCGNQAQLNATTSRGTGAWKQHSGPAALSFADAMANNTLVTSSAEGKYVLVWEEQVQYCPNSADTMELVFEYQPTANSQDNAAFCGLDGEVMAQPTQYNGSWSVLSGAASLNTADSNYSSLVSGGYGEVALLWTVVNDSLCPAATDTTLLEFFEQPTADAGQDELSCEDQIDISANPSVGSGYWSLADINDTSKVQISNFDQAQAAVLRKGSSFGSFNVVWNEENGLCPSTYDTLQVSFYDTPEISISGDEVICGLNSSLTAQLQVGAGEWSLTQSQGGVAIFSNPNANNTSVSVSTEGLYQFTFSADNQGYCPAEESITVRYFRTPKAEAGADQQVCGLLATLSASSETGKGYWTANSADISFKDSLASGSDVRSTEYGTYTLYYNESVGAACPVSVDSMQVTFVQASEADAGEDQVVCGLSTELNPIPSVGTGVWKALDAGITFNPGASSTYPEITADDFGSYRLVWSEFNGAPCDTIRDTVVVSFIPSATANIINSDTSLCMGDVFTLQIDFQGQAPYNFVLQGSDGSQQSLTSNTDSYQLDLSPSAIAVQYVIRQLGDAAPGSCVVYNQDSVMVQRYAVPTANISGDQALCEGEQAVVNLNFSGNTPFSYTLSNGQLYQSGGYAASHSFIPTADTSLSIVSISDSLCPGTTQGVANISFNALPSFTLAFDDAAVCEASYASYAVQAAGAAPYDLHYRVSGESLALYDWDGSLIDSVLASVPLEQIIVDSLIAKGGSKSCSAATADTASILVHALPQLQANMEALACDGSDLWMYVQAQGQAPFTLSYNDAAGQKQESNLNAVDSIFMADNLWGNITLLSISDANQPSCSRDLSELLTTERIQAPTLSLSVDPNVICAGEKIAYHLDFTGVAPFDYELSINGNQVSRISPATSYTDSLDLFVDTRIEVLRFSDGSQLECPVILPGAQDVQVKPLPQPDFSALNTEGCKPFSTQFLNGVNPNEIDSLRWDFGDGNISTQYNAEHEYAESGLYDVSLRIWAVNGCSNILEKPKFIEIYPDAVADFEMDKSPLTIDDLNVHFTNLSEHADSYVWTFNEVDKSTQENPSYEFSVGDSLQVSVCLEAQANCPDTLCKIIPVIGKHLVYVPNAFTPNGDGTNDNFKPEMLGADVEHYEFSVFNRWGERIFFTKNVNAGWDGSYEGKQVQEGIYPYKVIVKQQKGVDKEEIIGHVSLIR